MRMALGRQRVNDIAEGWEIMREGPIFCSANLRVIRGYGRYVRRHDHRHGKAGEPCGLGWRSASWIPGFLSCGLEGTCGSRRS